MLTGCCTNGDLDAHCIAHSLPLCEVSPVSCAPRHKRGVNECHVVSLLVLVLLVCYSTQILAVGLRFRHPRNPLLISSFAVRAAGTQKVKGYLPLLEASRLTQAGDEPARSQLLDAPLDIPGRLVALQRNEIRNQPSLHQHHECTSPHTVRTRTTCGAAMLVPLITARESVPTPPPSAPRAGRGEAHR